jgi:hypothetical protein
VLGRRERAGAVGDDRFVHNLCLDHRHSDLRILGIERVGSQVDLDSFTSLIDA